MANAKSKRSGRRAQPKKQRARATSVRVPASDVASNREAPGHRSVQFPQAKGKITEKIEFFTSDAYHAITIDFEDKTSLNFAIKPGFTINAELQHHKDEEIEVLLEWPPIPSE